MPDRSPEPALLEPAPFDGPVPFIPQSAGPPPAYSPPFEGRVLRTHKRCITCRRVFPRDGDEFTLKWSNDPYGLASKAQGQLRRRLGRKPTARQLARCKRAALKLKPSANARLQVQSICRECHRLRKQRLKTLRRLEAAAGLHGAVTERGEFYRTAQVVPLPTALAGLDALEPLAQAGIVLTDSAGPVLPAAPGDALRVCYAALLSPLRVGALGKERVALLERIPKLVKKAGPKHPMAKRAEDVRDVVLVREGGACENAAASRLISRLWKTRMRKAQAMIKSGALDRFEATTRLLEGIFDAVISWDPVHESGAALKTHAFNRIGRALQLRGRKDFAIAAQKGDDGRWYGGAASLHALLPADGEDRLVPHAVNYTAGNQAAVRVCAERRNEALTGAVQQDVSEALATLTPVDRRIAVRLWMAPEKVTMKQVAEEAGLDVPDVRARAKQIRALLGVLLKDHDKENEDDEDEEDQEG